MRRVFLLCVCLTWPAGLGCAQTPAAGAPAGSAAWRLDPLWDDGNAELCAYRVRWPRYGHQFPGRAVLVLVKEPWAPELDVKADAPRPDGFDVLKLNHVRDVPTGIYTYHQMASVFFRRDDGRLRKLAATSSEACGVSSAYLRDGRLELRSYFDGLGDRELPWPQGALPEDGLPALLRDFVAGGASPRELRVFPSLLDSRLAAKAPRRMRLTRRDVGELETPAGRFAAVELRLEDGDGWLAYRFERAAPHRLLEHRSSDGTVYAVERCGRLRYWEMHHPGGERWLPEAVR